VRAIAIAAGVEPGLVEEARDALADANAQFARDRLALVSAFGPGSIVIAHLLRQLRTRVPVVFVDTLHHFPETLALAERVTAFFGLDLRVFRAATTREEFESLHGPDLWARDLARYQRLTKIEPYARAMTGLDACITGRRREQAETRAALPIREEGQPVRFNPLASWRRADVWSWIRRHDLPYNPLHDRGYASIGDAPLTTPVRDGEHERAGRWRGTDRTECGIHFLNNEATIPPRPMEA
jgi:phosphoadenosine phosphosulfate reductase